MKSIYKDERWGKLQEVKEKGKAITYVFEKNGVKIIYPFIKRKAGLADRIEYFDLVTPRGQCGPWIEGTETDSIPEVIDAFNTEFGLYCADENIIAEYIRFCPFDNQSHYFSSIYNTNYYGHIYANDLTIDFYNLEYSKDARRNVRIAIENDVKIVFDTTPSSIDVFLDLYANTELKHDASDYYHLEKSFIERYLEMMPGNIMFANAVYEDEVILSNIILLGEDIAHFHFVGMNPEFLYIQANSLLKYKSCIRMAEMGKKLFDLGGAKAGSGVEAFKKKFVKGGKEYTYDLGTTIRNKDIYDTLVIQASGPRAGYFPAYRR